MRSTVGAASVVWSVAITELPISASVIAVCMVSIAQLAHQDHFRISRSSECISWAKTGRVRANLTAD